MGVTTWPCAGCGQQQRQEHQNSETPTLRLCASCQEEKDRKPTRK
jgi:hypothetical protein